MKHKHVHSSGPVLAVFLLATGFLSAAPDLQVHQPTLDTEGRFWVYHNGPAHPFMPFMPYGWMSDGTNLTRILQVDLECRDHPPVTASPTGRQERERCIRVRVTWEDAAWASVAFISGPDKPPWWGESNRGRYWNLSGLPKKKLVFFARGEHGGECIKAQIGTLGDKPFGDSLSKPVVTDDLKLTQDWTRHEIDLKDVPASELAHICNGFGVIAERPSQPGSPTETVFYVNDIYYE